MIEKVIKRLEYCIENKCDICQEENGSEFPWIDGRCYGFTERLYDAIALLKAQKPRVMTLEEVHTSEICWYENSLNYGYYVGHIIKEKLGYKLRTKYLKIGSTIVHVNFDEDYNESWRCWTSRPTDEQREATPWKT